MTTLLIIDDAVELADGLARAFRTNGYETRCAYTAREGLQMIESGPADLIILDWMLPDLDGLDVLRRLRQFSATPVLMLTARSDEMDRVIGLEIGADDYLVKPFGFRELLARVRALLRRDERLRELMLADRSLADADGVVQSDGLTLDPLAYQAVLDGAALELSHTEFELLLLMARNPGRTFTRRYLLETVWKETYLGSDRSVDNTVLRLRKKLGRLSETIETVRSVGYRWRR